eukprot:5397606-Prorocentrum_lima.AAC.1
MKRPEEQRHSSGQSMLVAFLFCVVASTISAAGVGCFLLKASGTPAMAGWTSASAFSSVVVGPRGHEDADL